jgi:hypothetical protein
LRAISKNIQINGIIFILIGRDEKGSKGGRNVGFAPRANQILGDVWGIALAKHSAEEEPGNFI